MDAPNGLFVVNVMPGGVAAAAGVHPGDVLLTVADASVATIDDIKAALASVHGEETVAADIWRNGHAQPIRLQF